MAGAGSHGAALLVPTACLTYALSVAAVVVAMAGLASHQGYGRPAGCFEVATLRGADWRPAAVFITLSLLNLLGTPPLIGFTSKVAWLTFCLGHTPVAVVVTVGLVSLGANLTYLRPIQASVGLGRL